MRASKKGRCGEVVAGLLLALLTVGCHNVDFSSRYGSGEIDIFDDLFAVSVHDEEHAVAVGYHGAAYWTDDGGLTWNKGRTPTNRLLYAVSMGDKDRGWAVGQLGTILRTEDGGRTWVEQPNLKKDEASHLFGVYALSPREAIAVGTWGSRIYTDDGGQTWHDNSLTVGVEHPQFVWLNQTDQAKVRRGEKVYEDVSLQDVFCRSDSRRCWLIGEFGYIFHSDDGGRTWTRGEILGDVRMDPIELQFDKLTIPEEGRERMREFASKIESEAHVNVLVDTFVSDAEIEYHFDGEDPEPLFEVISGRLDEASGVLEGAGIMIDRLRMYNKPPWDYADFLEHDDTFLERYIESRRAEKPMLKISVIQNPFLFTVRFKDDRTGLISGLGGVVLRSEDGGETWQYVETDRRQALFSVAQSAQRAVAIGEKGLVQYSEDGGQTWRQPSENEFPPVFTFMRDVRFEPRRRQLGFIVGQEGMVLRTTDGGDSWSQVLPPEDRRGVGGGFI